MKSRITRIHGAAAALTLLAGAGAAQGADVITGATSYGPLATPQALIYGHAFNDTDAGTPGLQIAGVPGTLLPTDVFYDDYAFSVSSTGFSTISATIDLGSVLNIDNLQARLYQGTLATTSTGSVGPALMAAWSARGLVASGTGSGDAQVINPISLAPGDYVLEIRGNVVGTSGGAYSGVMNLAVVPEPEGVALAMAGLFGLMVQRRRRAR